MQNPFRQRRKKNDIYFFISIAVIIIAAVILTLMVVTSTSPLGRFTGNINLAADICTETDSGMDPYNAGETLAIITGEAMKFSDYCRTSNLLVEYYCSEGKLRSETVGCNFYSPEWKCENGTCVK